MSAVWGFMVDMLERYIDNVKRDILFVGRYEFNDYELQLLKQIEVFLEEASKKYERYWQGTDGDKQESTT